MMTLDQLFDHGVEFAKKTFLKTGSLNPMWIAETANSETLAIVGTFDSDESKDQHIAMLKLLFHEKKVQQYVYLCEAWTVVTDAKKGLPESYKLGASLASHPDRTEVIQFMAEQKDGTQRHGQCAILRPEHDSKPRLGEFKRLPSDTHMEGRFVGLLKPIPEFRTGHRKRASFTDVVSSKEIASVMSIIRKSKTAAEAMSRIQTEIIEPRLKEIQQRIGPSIPSFLASVVIFCTRELMGCDDDFQKSVRKVLAPPTQH